MKKTLILFLLIALLPAYYSSVSARTKTLRLTTYNIQHGKGLDGKIDYERQARILHRAHADVAAIQEVDSMTERNGRLYALDEIGRKAKLFATFAPAINFQGGKYGVGILSKKRPISVRRIPLPGREEHRILLVAEFKHYVVASTHLSLTEQDRIASIPLIVAEASRWQKPFLLMGDLNDTPDSPFYRELQRHFLFLNPPYDKTYPTDAPDSCIDHVALFKPAASPSYVLSFYRTWVGDDTASDHRPLHSKVGFYFP